MKLLAQRVIQAGKAGASTSGGVNALCFSHSGLFWLDDPPPEMGPGVLVNSIVEVPRGINRVRSHLEILAPDNTPNRQIVASVQGGVEFLIDIGRVQPWELTHSGVRFIFNVEASLAGTWQVELRILLGYALAVRPPGPDSDSAAEHDEPPEMS